MSFGVSPVNYSDSRVCSLDQRKCLVFINKYSHSADLIIIFLIVSCSLAFCLTKLATYLLACFKPREINFAKGNGIFFFLFTNPISLLVYVLTSNEEHQTSSVIFLEQFL